MYMNEQKRVFKKTFIAVIYLAIFSGIGTGAYFLFRPIPTATLPPAPNTYPIEVIWSKAFDVGSETYSVGAKIKNPNTNFGASDFKYTFYFYSANNILIGSVTGSSFIWPGESKYLIEGGVGLVSEPKKVELKINNPEWREVSSFKSIALSVDNISHGKGVAGSGKFYSVDFAAANNTSYDLNKVFVSAVVFDKNNQPIAVNSTIFENLKSKEHRPFSIPWFAAFSGTPNRVDLIITTNLWDRPELIGQ